jgi:hypothetical protein
MAENKDRKSFGIDSLINSKEDTTSKVNLSAKSKVKEGNETLKITSVAIPEEKHKRLAILAIMTDKAQRDLINEGIDLILEKYAKILKLNMRI